MRKSGLPVKLQAVIFQELQNSELKA